ncbi:caspase-2-like, partial [Mercenaria mercenaria]|uniref:caspase-2-like n=1 Tax=Mercenaria mercenaria TaxID=6596 RepID=UPI00234F101C
MTEPMEVSTEPGIECYAMNNMFRGHAVIIANENFTGNVPNRSGAKMDALKMETLFKALDFHVSVFKALTSSDMKKIIKQASKSYVNLDADCFVLVLSTHGHEEEVTETPMHMHLPQDAAVWRHAVLGTDGLPVYVDDILELFDSKSDQKSFLKEKPKLFFLQACRSGHLAYRDGALASYDTGAKVKVSISSTNLSNIQPSDAGLHDDKFADLVTTLSSCRISQECVNETDSWLPRRDSPQQNVAGPVETDPPTPVPIRPVRQSTYDIVALTCPDDCLIMYPVTS